MDRIQMHKDLCKELNETYEKKNHDYGNSFGETFEKLGIISAVTRISDKYNRLASLCTLPEEERKVKDESITDTLLDMANYCIMTVIELHKDDATQECEFDEINLAECNLSKCECEHDYVLSKCECEHDYVKDDAASTVTHRYICSKCDATTTATFGI